MNPIAETLLTRLFANTTPAEVVSISEQWRNDEEYLLALKRVEAIEKDVGPIGIWRSKYENHKWSFQYPRRFDGVYRQLKYVYLRLFTSSPTRVAASRDIVYYSTAHVESCFKVFCDRKELSGYQHRSLSALARAYGSTLGSDLDQELSILGDAFGNPAKHEYDLQSESTLFGVDDAFAIYLVCRKLGYALIVAAGAAADLSEACEKGRFSTQTCSFRENDLPLGQDALHMQG